MFLIFVLNARSGNAALILFFARRGFISIKRKIRKRIITPSTFTAERIDELKERAIVWSVSFICELRLLHTFLQSDWFSSNGSWNVVLMRR